MSRAVITPHASHLMGIVEGEARCTECFAAPGWPIIERWCGDEPRQENAERDAAVLAAYRRDIPVKEIAADMGLSRETVGRIITRHETPVERVKRGRGRGPAITLEQAMEADRMQRDGVSWAEIGARVGRKRMSIKAAVGDMRRGCGPLAQAFREATAEQRRSA